MGIFSTLFRKWHTSQTMDSKELISSGDLITEITNGANLVEGKQTWEHAKEAKHDIELMKKCCEAELKTMEITGLVAAPYYFERVAILCRKEKQYRQEIDYCENYIRLVNKLYAKTGTKDRADVRKGPRYQAIVSRVPKAKALLKNAGKTSVSRSRK